MWIPLNNASFRNFIWLVINHAANALGPLILFPVIIQRLGFGVLGTYSIMMALLNIGVVAIDFSFHVTGVQDIVASPDAVSRDRIFSTVLSFRVLTATILSLLCLPFCMMFFDQGHWLYVWMGMVLAMVGHAFQSLWFLLACNNIRITALANMLCRVALVLAALAFVHHQEHAYLLYYFTGAAFALSGGIAFIFAIRHYRIRLRIVGWQQLREVWNRGFSIMLASFSNTLYLQIPVFALSHWFGSAVVGQYAFAEKLVLLFKQVIGVLAQSIYPKVCSIYQEGAAALAAFYRSIVPVFWFGSLAISAVVFVLAPWLVETVTTEQSPLSVLSLRLLIWIPVLSVAGLPLYQILLLRGLQHLLLRVFLLALPCCCILVWLLLRWVGPAGAALAFLLTELYMLIYFFRLVQKTDLQSFLWQNHV